MPELGPFGSVRGALSNERPYRDPHFSVTVEAPPSLIKAIKDDAWTVVGRYEGGKPRRAAKRFRKRGTSDVTRV